jgi:hypothetical protein
MAQWPAPLAAAARPIPANDYQRRDTLCGSAEGVQAWVLISQGGGRGLPAMMITIGRGGARNDRCDAPAPIESAGSSAATIVWFSDAISLCRAVLNGRTFETEAAALSLTGPVRLGDMDGAGGNRVLDFFGPDAQIHATGHIAGDNRIFLFAAPEIGKCILAASGEPPYADLLRNALITADSSWLSVEDGAYSHADGARIDVRYSVGRAETEIMHVFFARAEE